MERNLPHLEISSPTPSSYTYAKRVVVDPPPRPERDRNRHSTYLKQQLEQAWKDASNDEVVYHSTRKGVYLEFKGEANYALVTKSLENRRSKDSKKWVKLLNIRSVKKTIDEKETVTQYATVYIPHGKKNAFFSTIEKYATENVRDTDKPKKAALIESITDIKKALDVESFWQDSKDLIPTDEPEWCEVWLSSNEQEIIDQFNELLLEQKINSTPGEIRFPERAVKIVQASREQLATITRLSDDIAEYRRAKETAAFWLDQTNKEQAEWVINIMERLDIDSSSDVAVCILDTGVNNGHPLIAPVLKSEDCQSVDPAWGTRDHNKHGTLMAGISAYGNLQEILTHDESIQLRHCLESVKILPPNGTTEPKLWGYVTAQGIYKAEIQSPESKRISCMAVTSDDTRDRGRPSSWSAALDQLCSGTEDGAKRLLIVSAGNITDWNTANIYPGAQLEDSIHDPAQSWNALTIGAHTELSSILDPTLKEHNPIAPSGGLSPFSTTSHSWDDRWPIKPEILMEGGNTIAGIDGISIDECCPDLSLLSTYYDPQTAHFSPFNMTSAATAQAAWFAAQIQAEYPDYWPETIRGLMIHSAKWTKTLKQQFLENDSKTAYKQLLRICGYGIPNLERARYSASNSLTLIAQSELQPFDKKKGESTSSKDMHLYELPWPKETLQSLPPTTEVEMRITLSYFVEPAPGEIGWKDRYRYASHGLRFDLNAPLEDKKRFEKRINKKAQDENYDSSNNLSTSKHWVIGSQARDKGSIHSDIWKGSAAELADSNLIAVYPTIGWWRERSHLNKWSSKTRYALIVSINTPEESVDIYTPVANAIKTPIEITV